jgi:hypothetical protein
MKALLVNHNYDPVWLKEYPELEVTLYDRSDDAVGRDLSHYGEVYKVPNIGNVDYDKLTWLVENYHNLPDVFLWGKSNLFKYISQEEFNTVKDNKHFTPLLTQHHRVYADNTLPGGGLNAVSFYRDGMYHERMGIVNTLHQLMTWKHFKSWEEWCHAFRVPCVGYIPFPPGGNFILTRERVHRYSRDYYDEMRSVLTYTKLPLEAQFCERSYYLLWR